LIMQRLLLMPAFRTAQRIIKLQNRDIE
jgi:hypothetical protein